MRLSSFPLGAFVRDGRESDLGSLEVLATGCMGGQSRGLESWEAEAKSRGEHQVRAPRRSF